MPYKSLNKTVARKRTRAELKRTARRKAENKNGGLKKRSRRRSLGSFRAMRPGNGGNLGNIGNVESVTCRPHYPGDGTNPPSPLNYDILLSTTYTSRFRFQGNANNLDNEPNAYFVNIINKLAHYPNLPWPCVSSSTSICFQQLPMQRGQK